MSQLTPTTDGELQLNQKYAFEVVALGLEVMKVMNLDWFNSCFHSWIKLDKWVSELVPCGPEEK